MSGSKLERSNFEGQKARQKEEAARKAEQESLMGASNRKGFDLIMRQLCASPKSLQHNHSLDLSFCGSFQFNLAIKLSLLQNIAEVNLKFSIIRIIVI